MHLDDIFSECMDEWMNEQINACVNSPWNDLASFAFCTLRTIHLAAGLHMKLQYWDFCFASPTMVGLNKMLFRFQMLNWYSVKSLTASSCKKLKGLTLSPFGFIKESQAASFLHAGVHPLRIPAASKLFRDGFPMFQPVHLPPCLYPSRWGCALVPHPSTRRDPKVTEKHI